MSHSPTSNDHLDNGGSDEQLESIAENFLRQLQNGSQAIPDKLVEALVKLHPELRPHLRNRLQAIAHDFFAQRPFTDVRSAYDQQAETLALANSASVNNGDSHDSQPDVIDALLLQIAGASDLNPTAPMSHIPKDRLDTVKVGDQFGDYRLLEKIGRGGMGLVYRAEQRSLKRIVAIKLLLSGNWASEDEVIRFLREAEAAAALDHPAIVPVHEVGEHAGQYYFSMGYVAGRSLAQRIAESPLEPRSAAELTRIVAGAIHYAHSQGIIHRDIKPGNVLLDEHEQPRVTDFGLAKRVEGSGDLTATGQVLGTPSFMPPEQAMGRWDAVDARADVYSLGALLYSCITGRPPFQAPTIAATLSQVLNDSPVLPHKLVPRIPRDLETICLKCLEKKPDSRYATAADLADDLRRFLDGAPVQARRLGLIARSWRWCRKRPVVSTMSAVAICSLLAATLAMRLTWEATKKQSLAQLTTAIEMRMNEISSDPASLSAVEAVIEQLAATDPMKAISARNRMHLQYAQAIQSELAQPRLTEAEIQRLATSISSFSQRDSALAGNLSDLLLERRYEWQMTGEFHAPYGKLPEGLEPDAFAWKDGQLFGAEATTANQSLYRATNLQAQGDVEFEVAWGQQWSGSSQLGLELRCEGGAAEDSYRLVFTILRTEAVDRSAPAIADDRRQNGTYNLEFSRPGILLQSTTGELTALNEMSLRLRIRREDARWLIQLNDQAPLEIEEIFPRRSNETIHLRVVCPPDVALLSAVARQRRNPRARSPLEDGDEHYRNRRFPLALEQYQIQERTTTNSQFRAESRLKQAICLDAMQRTSECDEILEGLLNNDPPWSMHAASRLWLSYLKRGRNQDADVIVANLTTRYQFEDLARHLSVELRKQILAYYRGQWNVYGFMPNPDRIQQLERAVRVQALLDAPRIDYWETRWALVVAYLREAKYSQAEVIIADWLSESDCDFFDRYQLVTAQAGIYVLAGNFKAAIAFVNRSLFDDLGQIRSEHAPLLIVRAIVNASSGNWRQAHEDLELFLAQTDRQKYDRRPEVVLLRGFIAEALDGNLDRARTIWHAGLESGRKSKQIEGFFLTALSGSVDFDDALKEMDLALAGGKSSPTARLFQQALISDVTVMALVSCGANTLRGRTAIREMLLLQRPRDQMFHVPQQVAAYGFIRWLVLGHYGSHQELEDDFDGVLWQLTEELYGAYLRGEFVDSDTLQLYLAWRGTENALGWKSLHDKLKPALRGHLAFMLGCHYLQQNNVPGAERMLQTAVADAPVGAALRKYAERIRHLGLRATPPNQQQSYLGGDLLTASQAWRVAAVTQSTSDDLEWRRPNYDDSSWAATTLPYELADGGAEYVHSDAVDVRLRVRTEWEAVDPAQIGDAIVELQSPFPTRVYFNDQLVAEWTGTRAVARGRTDQGWSIFASGHVDRTAFLVPREVWRIGKQVIGLEIQVPPNSVAVADARIAFWITAQGPQVLQELLVASIPTSQQRAALCFSVLETSSVDSDRTNADGKRSAAIAYRLGPKMAEQTVSGEAAAMVRYAVALRRWLAGDWNEAVAEFERALEISPDHVLARRDRGSLLIEMGRTSEGADDLQVSAQRIFDEASLWLDLSDARYRLQDFPAATRAAENARHVDPAGWRTKFALGRSSRTQNRMEQAIALFREALVLQPNNGIVHYYLGESLIGIGNHIEALPHLESAVRSVPHFPYARVLLVQAYRKSAERFPDAERHVEESLRDFPQDPDLLRLAVEIALHAGRRELAVERAEALEAVDPNNPASQRLLAIAYRSMERWTEAIRPFHAAIRFQRNELWDAEFGELLGDLPDVIARDNLLALEPKIRLEAAFSYVGRLLRERRWEAYRNCCQLLISQQHGITSPPKDNELAHILTLTAHICSLSPDSGVDRSRVLQLAEFSQKQLTHTPHVSYTLALALYRVGRLGQASSILEGIIRHDPIALFPINQSLLALIRLREGNQDEALKWIRRAGNSMPGKQAHPQNQVASEMLREELERFSVPEFLFSPSTP